MVRRPGLQRPRVEHPVSAEQRDRDRAASDRFGIAARNGILMIATSSISGGTRAKRSARLRGAKERLAPILMTASAAGFALVPLAVAGSVPGHEIEHPMAIVILGGLVTSTLLNLFVVPSLYLRFAKPVQRGGLDAPRPATAAEQTETVAS